MHIYSNNDMIQSMKRCVKVALLTVLCLSLTGCGSLVDMPELSEEQEEVITEYAAGLMLKYDTKYTTSLLDEDELAKRQEKEANDRAKERAYKEAAEAYLANKANESKNEHVESDSKQPSESYDTQISDIASFYGLDGFTISYTGYELCESYPSSGADLLMAMDATDGKQLLVLSFDVQNVSGGEANFDMFYRKPSFTITLNGSEKVRQQATLLLDDMAAYNGSISAGSSEPMVLIYEVDDSVTGVDSLVMTVKNDTGKGSMTLQ